jgi:hypothetical protein
MDGYAQSDIASAGDCSAYLRHVGAENAVVSNGVFN